MTESDLRMMLDGETADVLNQPSLLAAPAQAVREALHAPEAGPEDAFSEDDDPYRPRPADSSAQAEVGVEASTRAGPSEEIGPAILQDRTASLDPAVGAALAPGGETIPGPAAASPAPPAQVVIHAVNYYARPASSLSDLPNEWAGNRARP